MNTDQSMHLHSRHSPILLLRPTSHLAFAQNILALAGASTFLFVLDLFSSPMYLFLISDCARQAIQQHVYTPQGETDAGCCKATDVVKADGVGWMTTQQHTGTAVEADRPKESIDRVSYCRHIKQCGGHRKSDGELKTRASAQSVASRESSLSIGRAWIW